jgi:Zn-dependent peptidase ImmA (M78 family)
VAEVPVNGKVLQWARAIRGLDIDQAATLLDLSAEELREYESETKHPLVGLLRKMSAKYRINFSSLLMPEPLPIKKPPTDYRFRHTRQHLSIDTLVAMEEVNEALDAFEDFAAENIHLVPKLNIGTVGLSDDPEAIAERERKKFGVTIADQMTWQNGPVTARREWRKRIEDHGIFTYMIPMPPAELSGFSLYRQSVVAICVNDNEATEGRKVFTLFHEYCHLLLRQDGISDENNSNQVEKFCNAFAASFLLPRNALAEAVGNRTDYEFSEGEVKKIAARFRVSSAAVALRLEKTGFAPRGFYGRRIAPWDLPEEPKTSRTGTPNQITIQLKRIGRLHAKTVLRAVDQHVINSFDASQLVGLQPSSLPKLQAKVG